MTISQWIHLTDNDKDLWVLPIFGASDSAHSRSKYKRLSKNHRELGLYITIKRSIIKQIAARIKNEIKQLYKTVENHKQDHVFTLDKEGCAFPINTDLIYNLVSDIESLLFQLLSCWQITKRFVLHIHLLIEKNKFPRKQIDSKINNILTKQGNNTEWISHLITHRDFLAHIGGAYLAIDISSGKKESWDVLIMKSNIKKFDKRDEYITFSELNSIFENFKHAMDILQDHLVSFFNSL